MVLLATNWTTISSLATGIGTLVLAIATFASVRSSNRSARVAEEALLEQRQPVFSSSRFDDPAQKVDVRRSPLCSPGRRSRCRRLREWERVPRDQPTQRRCRDRRLPGVERDRGTAGRGQSAGPPSRVQFRTQTRDLYIPPGDIGIWQGALRELDDPDYPRSSRRSRRESRSRSSSCIPTRSADSGRSPGSV